MTDSDVKKSFGNSVRIWRRQLGLSQEELAERADLHRTYVSDVERGARNLSLQSIAKLAQALQVTISDFFHEPALPEESTGMINRRSFMKKLVDVLLVEDNADDLEMTLHAFTKARFANHINVVRDGEEALDYLFCRGQYARRNREAGSHIILLDLNLPKVSGLEVLRQIKADKHTRSASVVILTVSARGQDIDECLRLGADGYIVKPVDFQALSRTTPQLNLDWALLKPIEPPAPRIVAPAD